MEVLLTSIPVALQAKNLTCRVDLRGVSQCPERLVDLSPRWIS